MNQKRWHKMKNSIRTMSLELAREISDEVKRINERLQSGELSQAQIKGQLEAKRELNKERIKALGLTLIQGGKCD
jgi:hypothetical protein